jgi:chaperonin GroEL
MNKNNQNIKNNNNVMYMNKDIILQIKGLLECVKYTFGPGGRPILLMNQYNEGRLSQDGAKIIKEIKTNKPEVEGWLNLMVKSIFTVAEKVGDGTTTISIIICLLIEKLIGFYGTKEIKNIIDGINIAAKESLIMIEESYKQTVSITDTIKISQIASVSSKSNEIGKLVSEAFTRVNGVGVVEIIKGNSTETTLKNTKGYSFDKGYLSSFFVTDKKKNYIQFENCLIMVCNGKITQITPSLTNLLHSIIEKNQSLLIIADEIDESVMGILIFSNSQGLKNVCVQSPSFGDYRKNMLQDIAVLTNTIVIEAETNGRGMSFNNITIESLGFADLVKVSQKETVISCEKNNDESISLYKEQLKYQLENNQSSYETGLIRKRIGMMESGICSIIIGGYNEAEQNEKYDLVEDSVSAVKSALSEGVCTGGMITMIQICEKIKNNHLNDDNGNKGKISINTLNGINIFCQLGDDLLYIILENIFSRDNNKNNPSTVIEKIHNEINKGNIKFGYNALTMEYSDNMEKDGVIEPVLVLKSAIETSVNLLNLLFSSPIIITNQKEI